MKTQVKDEDKMNDVYRKDFVSRLDKNFTLKEKDKGHWGQRRESIKLWGTWT